MSGHRPEIHIKLEPPTAESYAPFGWVLGVPPRQDDPTYWSDDDDRAHPSTWWTAHVHQPGKDGQADFVVNHYARAPIERFVFECHLLMEQAYLPVSGRPLIHIVCPPPDDLTVPDIRPNLSEIRAFLLSGSDAVAMKRGCWHLNAALVDDSVYVLVGRESSTLDIAHHRRTGSPLEETLFYDITDEATVNIGALL